MICARCERKNVEPDSPDPDFCKMCFDVIERVHGDPMAYARAAGAFVRSQSNYSSRLEIGAFLAVFHPEMADSIYRAVMSAVR